MTEIQGKSTLVRVSARFELAGVRVIGSRLYIPSFTGLIWPRWVRAAEQIVDFWLTGSWQFHCLAPSCPRQFLGTSFRKEAGSSKLELFSDWCRFFTGTVFFKQHIYIYTRFQKRWHLERYIDRYIYFCFLARASVCIFHLLLSNLWENAIQRWILSWSGS